MDRIFEDKSFKECRNLYCVYKYLWSRGDNVFCHNIWRFNDSDKIDLHIKVKFPLGNKAQVSQVEGHGVTMDFHREYVCDNDNFIEIAHILIHESFHARFRYDLAKTNEMSHTEYKKKFKEFYDNKFGTGFGTDEHFVIIQGYMHEMAESLWEFNNKKFKIEDYMGFVWDGLKFYWDDKFSEIQLKDWNEKKVKILNSDPIKLDCDNILKN